MKFLITGGAGFIGSHAAEHLLSLGHQVVALDNFDPFYSPARKRRNVETALAHPNYTLEEGDYGGPAIVRILKSHSFDAVLHLAARGGVRPSIEDPFIYQRVNVASLMSLLEAMKEHGPRNIVAASSSAVYGDVTPAPFREDAECLQPLSPYGATKRASEIYLGTWCSLYKFKAIVVRPFTVYGPRQRPDMAIAAFAQKILMGEPITLYGEGTSARDYTYVSDIVDGLTSALLFPVSFGIYNLGSSAPATLSELVATLERTIGKKAIIVRAERQKGDVEKTYADIAKARRDLNFNPKVNLEEGIRRTVAWAKEEIQIRKS